MKARAEALQSIAGQSFDVCVIGGGATGLRSRRVSRVSKIRFFLQ